MAAPQSSPGPRRVPRRGFRRAWLFGGVFALALTLRAAVAAVNLAHAEPLLEYSDSRNYLLAAAGIAERLEVAAPDEPGGWSRAPGYPAFLAAMFSVGVGSADAPADAVMGQLGVSALVVVLASLLGLALTDRAWVGAATGAVAALEPSGVAYANVVMSETLYALGLAVAALAWWRWSTDPHPARLALLALCVGLLPLVKPGALYFALPLAILVAVAAPAGAGRWASAALFLLVASAPPLAWSLRNYRELGAFELSHSGAWAMALFAYAVEHPGEAPPPTRDPTEPWARDFGADRGLDAAAALAGQRAYFRRVVAAEPLRSVAVWTRNGVLLAGVPNDLLPDLLLADPPGYAGGSVSARLRWLVALGPLAPWVALGPAVSLGGLLAIPLLLWQSRSWSADRRSLLLCIALLVSLQLSTSALVSGQADRYRMPLMPLLAAALASGGAALSRGRGVTA